MKIFETNCLNNNEYHRFNQQSDKIQKAITKAVKGLLDKNSLPYIPKIYILPHYQKLISGRFEKIAFNMLGTDPIEKNQLSIFISLPFLEEFSEKKITMTIIHELVHLINHTYTSKNELRKLLDKKKISLKEYDEYSHYYQIDLSNFFSEESLSLYTQWESITQSKKFTKDMNRKRKKRKDYVTLRNHDVDFPKYFWKLYKPRTRV